MSELSSRFKRGLPDAHLQLHGRKSTLRKGSIGKKIMQCSIKFHAILHGALSFLDEGVGPGQ